MPFIYNVDGKWYILVAEHWDMVHAFTEWMCDNVLTGDTLSPSPDIEAELIGPLDMVTAFKVMASKWAEFAAKTEGA